MALIFKEKVGTEQPGGIGAALEASRAAAYFLLDGGTGPNGSVTSDDVQSAITEILGFTEYDEGDGRLQRTPPLAHGMFPFLFASNISKAWGVGASTKTASDPAGELEVPPVPNFALYQQYWFAVDFSQRPYSIAQDQYIQLKNGQWYKDDGTLQTFGYAPEWYRYADYTRIPANSSDNNLTRVGGQYGTMNFQTGDGSNPNGIPFPGTLQFPLPNSIIQFTWFAVPYRYVLSSNQYFDRWRNRVNQNAWDGLNFTAQPGELLFLDYAPSKYQQPVQELELISPGIFANEKLCNITFMFLFTRRKGTSLPAAPANMNFVVGGHNLLPWFEKRAFYYSHTNSGYPTYLSFPLEILFTDPDAAGGIPA